MAAFPHHPAYFVPGLSLEPERFTVAEYPCFSPSPFLSHEYIEKVPFQADETIHQIVDGMNIPPNFTTESLVNVNLKSCSSSWVVNDVPCIGSYQDSTLINTVQPKRKQPYFEAEKESKGGNCGQNHEPEKTERKRLKPRARKEKEVADEGQQPLTKYVQVRARRGEATDSHSLAERVRREKLQVRMKLLQSLVPGCDKLTGKARILDEIIRYIIRLQSQVEFLAEKLTSDVCVVNGINYDISTHEVFSSEFQEASSTDQIISLMEAIPASMLGGSNSIL